MKFLKNLFRALIGKICLVAAFVLFLPIGVALAQEGEPTGNAANLQQCVEFFVHGTPVDRVLGGIFLLATILGLFFRTSVLSIIRDIVGKILGGKKA